jgi:hypothetical protein
MRFIGFVSNTERWNWFAAGDGEVISTRRAASERNAPVRVLFEIGLVLAVPLAAATAICIAFGT